jgi:hypothetical protein
VLDASATDAEVAASMQAIPEWLREPDATP